MDATIAQDRPVSVSQAFNLNKIILLIAAALVLRAFFVYSPPIIPLKIGDPLPDFKIRLFDGSNLDRKAILGHPHVFFFYANWCPCSNFSADSINRAYKDYSSKGIRFTGIGFQDKREGLAAFVRRHHLPFPVGPDTTNEVSRTLGVGTPPTTLFVDAAGKVSGIFVGKIKQYGDITPNLEKIAE